MKRTPYTDRIDQWIAEGKNALMVTGARQTGKTFLIRERLEASGRDYVELNLLERPDAVRAINSAKGASDLLLRLSAILDKPLIPGNTIFFFDEVQEAKELVTQIKFLVDEGSYRYILSGSLLGVTLKDLRSAPVGYLTLMDMYPLSFREFLEAIGIQKGVLEHLRESFRNRTPVDDFVHDKILDAFYLYQIVGGMPAAVQEYLDTNDLNRVADIQRNIIRLYKQDFTKYEHADKLSLIEVYDSMAAELNSKSKRFRLNSLGTDMSYERAENSFLWLKDAGVALPVYNVTEPTAPLMLNAKRNLFKLFFSDVGLLTSFYPNSVRADILNRASSVNNGALFENCVAQELTAHGIHCYYYNSKKLGEVDFLIEWQGRVLPIEVKSGKDYKRHVALENLFSVENYSIEGAYVLSGGNVETVGKRIYLPVYMVMFLEEAGGEFVYKLDLSGL